MPFLWTPLTNNKNLSNWEFEIDYKLTNWLWKYLCNYFSIKVHPLFTMDFWNTTTWSNQQIGMIENRKVHIEFHSKLCIMTQLIYDVTSNNKKFYESPPKIIVTI